jgi:hypothetical protein
MFVRIDVYLNSQLIAAESAQQAFEITVGRGRGTFEIRQAPDQFREQERRPAMLDGFSHHRGGNGSPTSPRALGARKSSDDPRRFIYLFRSQPLDLRNQFLNRCHTFTLRHAQPKIHPGEDCAGVLQNPEIATTRKPQFDGERTQPGSHRFELRIIGKSCSGDGRLYSFIASQQYHQFTCKVPLCQTPFTSY